MTKFALVVALMTVGSFGYAGECASGKCLVRSRVVNVTREVVSVPVTVTRKVVDTTRTFGRRSVSRVRDIVR